MSNRITCRKEPNESGLARVCQLPRGFIISIGGVRVARVGGARSLARGASAVTWHWYGHRDPDVPRRNSAAEGIQFATREDARDNCVAYLRECLASARAAKEARR